MNNKLGIRKDDWEELIKKYPNQKRLIKKLNNGYPVQYLLEKTNFYGNRGRDGRSDEISER